MYYIKPGSVSKTGLIPGETGGASQALIPIDRVPGAAYSDGSMQNVWYQGRLYPRAEFWNMYGGEMSQQTKTVPTPEQVAEMRKQRENTMNSYGINPLTKPAPIYPKRPPLTVTPSQSSQGMSPSGKYPNGLPTPYQRQVNPMANRRVAPSLMSTMMKRLARERFNVNPWGVNYGRM